MTKIKFRKPKLSSFSSLKHSVVGFYVSMPIFLCLTIGLFLDSILNTRPTFTLVFLGLGVLSSFYNIYKVIKEKK